MAIHWGGRGAGRSRRPINAAPIVPTTLFAAAEQGVWIDPQDLASMWQATGGTTAAAVGSPVGRIDDKSGRLNHMSAPVDAKRPTLRQLGSYYYIDFDGTDDVLRHQVSMGATTFTRIAVLRLSWVLNSRVYTQGAGGSGGWLLMHDINPQYHMASGLLGPFITAPSDQFVVLSEVYNGATSKLRVNAGPWTGGDNGAITALAGFSIGGEVQDAAGTSQLHCNMDVAGLVYRAGVLTDAQIEGVEVYLANRAGVGL